MLRRFGPGTAGLCLIGVALLALAIRFGPGLAARPHAPAPQAAVPQAAVPHAAAQGPGAKRVLRSTLAGQWYPADPKTLVSDIRGYLEAAKVEPLAGVRAILLPHAGYRYSGRVAAHALKEIAGRTFRRVVILGPSHRVPMENVASVPEGYTHYATPLGEVPLDLEFLRALRRHPVFQSIPEAHAGEHSVQIEVPLLQETIGTFSLVPVVVGQLDLETARRIGAILLGLLDDETLVVASCDFTHYGENYGYFPFREDVPANLRKLDMRAFERIRARDLEGFYAFLKETRCTICGRYPISVLLSMLAPGAEAHLLRYDTSGSITGDYTSSVSYVAAAFTGAWPSAAAVAPPAPPAPPAPAARELGKEDRGRLLRLARRALTYALEKRRVPEPSDLDIEVTPAMRAVRGAFVTLEERDRLRGCIGDIFPQRPLFRSVIRNAIHAALNDPRFPPVAADEVPRLHIEISVLTPQRPVSSYEEIVVGKHGVVLTKDGHRAVYLPQVAPEQGWTRDEMLSHLSVKAGLAGDAWREGASFTVFEAVVFGEGEG